MKTSQKMTKPTAKNRKDGIKTNHDTKSNSSMLRNKWLGGGIFILLAAFILFSPSLSYEFVNWDDEVNIHENIHVRNFDIEGIFTSHVIGNYNPLANLTFAVEYRLVGENPWWYHFNNLMLHLLCTLLVLVLLKKMEIPFWVSFVTALLFAIHPMRVESVVWITERKDVLFAAFYLLSLIFYIQYIRQKKAWYYVLALLVFILSLLSKIQAVALPLSLLLVDYWFSRKLSKKLVLEKIPFFVLSLATGLVGIYFLRQQGSLDTTNLFPLHQRMFIGSYSFVVYLLKSGFPWEMTAVYPYPAQLTALFYLSMIPALAVAALPVIFFRKNRYLTFGLLFFIFNIAFMLQVVGAGQGFIADRFTYLPYLGLFLLFARGIGYLTTRYPRNKMVVVSLTAVGMIALFTTASRQVKVWENSKTLWTDVLSKQPKLALAYNNLGLYYRQAGNPGEAIKNYNLAIQYDPSKSYVYNNRGKVYFERGDFDQALDDCNKCLEIKPDHVNALSNRGAIYGIKKNYGQALADLTRALELDPQNTSALSNRGVIYFETKEYEKTIGDYLRFLQIEPGNADIINT
ncbi:MAG: tetratricopeptide repeat protein, partial [Bacteroidia bacterium]|nr:tetratricopeptide repeat protein [Bacteroidia bacterium]